MTVNAKTLHLLDSYALLAFFNRERGFETVRQLLHDAHASGEHLLMNEVNIGEVYYIIAKGRSLDHAEEFLHRFETLPIRPLPNAFRDVLDAAKLKAQFPISYADAFVVATAQRVQAVAVTGDPEFHAVSHLIEIMWL